MAEYHVGCGIAAIYAGTIKREGEWKEKSCVTEEAVRAVADWMYNMIPKDEKTYGYIFNLKNGKRLRLAVEILDEVTP